MLPLCNLCPKILRLEWCTVCPRSDFPILNSFYHFHIPQQVIVVFVHLHKILNVCSTWNNMPKKSFGNLRPVSNFLLPVVWFITDGTDILTYIRIYINFYGTYIEFYGTHTDLYGTYTELYGTYMGLIPTSMGLIPTSMGLIPT